MAEGGPKINLKTEPEIEPKINPVIKIDLWPGNQPLRIILGAGDQSWPGWIATDRETLDLLRPDQWVSVFKKRQADAFLSEHAWEHLTEDQAREAATLCFHWLKPGGYLRCAVPDGNFPDPEYRQKAKVGGPAGHKVLYNHRRLSDLFEREGFWVDLLEYCDGRGRFHYHQWDIDDGPVYRSLRMDHRNQEGRINNVSLILDAHKPK